MNGATAQQRKLIAVYIADVARRFREMDRVKAELYANLGVNHAPKVNRKTLREECWFVWHSFTNVGPGKYSPYLPWSPRAIEARKADPKAPLVIEHVEPFTLFCERLEARIGAAIRAGTIRAGRPRPELSPPSSPSGPTASQGAASPHQSTGVTVRSSVRRPVC